MKKRMAQVFLLCFACACIFAHSQMIYTPTSVIDAKADTVNFIISFTHPFESGFTMDIGKNEKGEIKGFKEFYSIHKGKKTDLIPALKNAEFESAENKASAFTLALDKTVGFKGGGDWVLVGVPHPYFEAADDAYIQQIAKVCINKSSLSTDWQKRCAEGYPEIMPLVKPYEVVKGGVFRAVVLGSDGKPVPNAEIEFTNVNYDVDMENNRFTGEAKINTKILATGTVLADANGTFSFVPPAAGYWCFIAQKAGKEKEFAGRELAQDALIWVEAFEPEEIRVNTAMVQGVSSGNDMQGAGVTQRAGFSPAALIIVVLLFVVMFAWPPLFKKMSEK